MDELVRSSSLRETVEFLQSILARHPDARVCTYETPLLNADYDETQDLVVFSGSFQ